MASTETLDIVEALENSRLDVLSALSGLSASRANVTPDPSRWSALQCMEHVIAVEERFLERLAAATRQESCEIDPQRESELASRIANRKTRVKAPEAVHPTGKFATLVEAIEQFNAIRMKTSDLTRNRAPELYYLSVDHGRFGRLNGVELLLVIAAHARRHADQIREIREAVETAQ